MGLAPEQFLAAPADVLRGIVAGPGRRNGSSACAGARSLPSRERRGAPTPGIGKPGTDRLELFTGTRAVLAVDASGLRVLVRLGFAD